MGTSLSFVHLIFVGFVALLPPVNPIGTALVVDPLFRDMNLPERRAAALKIAAYCFSICCGALLIGSWLFKFFGISLPVVQLAGGIMICRMGWELLSADDKSNGVPQEGLKKDPQDVLFYPVAFPMTTGAGTISVLLTLSAHGNSEVPYEYFINLLALFAAVLLMTVVIYWSYAYTPAILRRLGQDGRQIVNRISAFLVFCVGLQIGIDGIQHLLGK